MHRQIWVDRTYNAGVFMQGIDRTHRLGMDPNADAWAKFLCSDGTIDERVAAGRLETKVANMARLLDDPDLLTLALPDFDDTLSVTDLFLDGATRRISNLSRPAGGGVSGPRDTAASAPNAARRCEA